MVWGCDWCDARWSGKDWQLLAITVTKKIISWVIFFFLCLISFLLNRPVVTLFSYLSCCILFRSRKLLFHECSIRCQLWPVMFLAWKEWPFMFYQVVGLYILAAFHTHLLDVHYFAYIYCCFKITSTDVQYIHSFPKDAQKYVVLGSYSLELMLPLL